MSEEKSLLLSEAKNAHPLQMVRDRVLHFNNISVLHTCISPNYFSEHSDSRLKIAVPLKSASIQAAWQTATGRQRRQCVKSGHVSIIPENQPREIVWERKAEIVAVYLAPELLAHVADESNIAEVEIVEQWTARDPLLQQLGLALRAEFLRGLPGNLYIESVANVLAQHLLRHYSASEKPIHNLVDNLPQHKLRRAIEYIDDNLEHDVTLAQIAASVEMSPYRFARAFKQSTGLPPHQYMLERRIDRAKMLLSETQLPIAEISYRLGFSSQSHFTATFRRLVAMTPKAYREVL